jgi:hypothetical protein
MMIDCAALVTVSRTARKQQEIELGLDYYRKAGSGRVGDGAKVKHSGNFGNQSTGTLIAIKGATAARPAPFGPRKIVNQAQNTCQDVLQSNEIIRHGSRGQKPKCRIPPALNVKKKQEFA